MTDPDIVTRLRAVLHNDRSVELMNREAADEIERLRNERNAFEAERDELVRISNKLKHERDEARREVCVLMQRTGFLRGDYAAERGWDCFKEMKP